MKYTILGLFILTQLLFPNDSTNVAIFSKPFVRYVGQLPMVPIGGGIEIDSTKMNPKNLTDSNYFSIIEFPSGNRGSSFGIEMPDSFSISSIRVGNIGNFPTIAFNLRLRSFSMYGSNDTIVWSKIFQEPKNQDSSNYLAVVKSKQRYKYLKIIIDSMHASTSTVVSDLKVFVLTNPNNIDYAKSHSPRSFTLQQNYPNPFNPSTRINFENNVTSNIKIVIYDPLGRMIETIFDNEVQPGKHTVQWNAMKYASGIYYCIAYAKNQIQSIRLTLIK